MKLNLIALFLLLFVGVVHAQLPTNFEEITLVSPSDSLELSVLIAYPETEPIAVLQLVHGMCEHKERYIPLMRFLSQHGYVCVKPMIWAIFMLAVMWQWWMIHTP